MKKQTKSTSQKDIERRWHIIDAKDKVLGRISTEIASILMGKSKPNFVRNLDCGDYVIVINSKYIKVTGKKLDQKTYARYSGYPGGLKVKTLKTLLREKPTEPIRHAVYGMLPKNRLRDRLIIRLYVYPEETHPYKDKVANVSK